MLLVGNQRENKSVMFRASSVEEVLCHQFTPAFHFSDLAFGQLPNLFPPSAVLWAEVSFCCFIVSHLLIKYNKLKLLPFSHLSRGKK